MIEARFQPIPNFSGEPFKSMRQFGYSLFSAPVSTFAPVDDVPVGPNYVLGPGDDLTINVWGAMESGVIRTVNRNGEIILPSVGPLRVWGLTFSHAERLIREQLQRYYRGFQTSVTMGRLRAVRVYVVGEVCQPGSFTVSSLSTVTNALFTSGGPLKLGSLRNIQLKRDQHVVGTVDLYEFLLRGDKTRDFRLEPGDTIFVPPVGPVVAIQGEVKRPAIYELNGPTRIRDLIDMAGGLMPQSYLKRVQVIRTKPNAEREAIDLDLTSAGQNGDAANLVLQDGDLVRIHPSDPRIYNTVRLAGAVKHPGEYELKPGMRLREVLTRESVLPEAHLERVDVARVKDDLTTEIIQVNLKDGWNGDPRQDLMLKPRDLVTVRSEYRTPWSVTLGGEVKRPGTYTIKPGERLSSVLKRVGGFTDKAFLEGSVFIRRTVAEAERARVDDFIRTHEQRLLSEAGQLTQVAFGLSRDEAVAQQTVLMQRVQGLRMLASKITLGRVVIHLAEPDKLAGSANDIMLEDGDMLTVPQRPVTVVVMGSVRNPTAVLHQEGMDVQQYLNRAGGMTPDADQKGLYLIKADGSAITGFMRLRNIEPGDVIVAPPTVEAKVQWGPLIKDLATFAGQMALGLAALAAIF
ncbi:MAG: SLBB domain-containing protein [Deltaproteobacteria bacterium]|nr:SLBB domain-containing protein [Deltaproteobacteria bacterium]